MASVGLDRAAGSPLFQSLPQGGSLRSQQTPVCDDVVRAPRVWAGQDVAVPERLWPWARAVHACGRASLRPEQGG